MKDKAKKDSVINFRVSQKQKMSIQSDAMKYGMNVAEYLLYLVQHKNVIVISGGKELAEAVARVTGAADFAPDALALSSERQRSCCETALENVNEALSALAGGVTLDAVNICMDSAADSLLELTGKRVRNAVADEIFARFCVGK